MSKILYIGHYEEGSGWAKAAIEGVLALDAAGVDVVPRTVKLGGKCGELPKRFLELMEKDSSGCDYCIQHVLPPYMVYSGEFKKCVGLFASETSNFTRSGWQNSLNMMDEVWVVCKQQIDACKASGVTKPIRVVPHAYDTSIYNEPRKWLDFGIGDEFTFLTVGEYSQRKNFAALLIAFYTEFAPEEPARLVFKINSPHFSEVGLRTEFVNYANKIKKDLNLYGVEHYKPEIIITRRLTDEEMLDLHYTCDGYVCPSHGEAWSLGCFEAMAFGKMPIASDIGGMSDYIINHQTGFLLEGQLTPVMNVSDSLPGLFVGSEDWFSPSIPEMKKRMRTVYNNMKRPVYRDKVRDWSRERVEGFSYLNVGKLMEGYLNG